jgi:SAM-dependent methyltransferase
MLDHGTGRPSGSRIAHLRPFSRGVSSPPWGLAARADRHRLYELSVQSVPATIDSVERIFRERRGRDARVLREDFCGTAAACCEWVRRREDCVAIGLDLDASVLEWARRHNVAALSGPAAERVRLLNCNVLEPGPDGSPAELVLAFNFSHWTFTDRDTLRAYFRRVHASLAPDGLFLVDHYGGSDSGRETQDLMPFRVGRLAAGPGGPPYAYQCTYVWDQARYSPVTGEYVCYIHYLFPDGSRLERAFEYRWRLWTLPEIRELLGEAGFSRSTVYLWEDRRGTRDNDPGYKAVERTTAESCVLAIIAADP